MICNKTESCFFELLQLSSGVTCQQKNACVHFCDNRKDAVCKEKGKQYCLRNKNNQYRVLSLHIDGGVITTDNYTPEGTAKCDYLYLINSEPKPTAILIELKGTDFTKAIKQIKNTLVLFENAFKKCGKVYGRIVFSGGTPNIQNTPAFMSLQKEFKKRGGSLLAKSTVLDDIVEHIC